MKIVLEFKDEDAEEALTALDGYKWKLAMWELDQLLRLTTKYDASILNHNEQAIEIEYKITQKIREEILRILENYKLKLD